MRKLILLIFSSMLIFSVSCTGKELTFEEKMMLSGNTNDTADRLIDESIKTFEDYEQKEIIPRYKDPAIVKVKCNKVNHYLYINDGLLRCKTINIVTITEVIKLYDEDVYQENQQIELFQHYGYMPRDKDGGLDTFFEKEYHLKKEEVYPKENSEYYVDLNRGYHYVMMSVFEDTVPLDEDEEYLMVLESTVSAEDNSRRYHIAMVVPYNTEKYRRVFNNECGFVFSEYEMNLRNELRKTFME
ncbi:MAG: hypothetical protein ACLSVG_11735 [Clostridia bacterium]